MCLDAGAPADPSLCDGEAMPSGDGDCNVEECVEASGDSSTEDPSAASQGIIFVQCQKYKQSSNFRLVQITYINLNLNMYSDPNLSRLKTL